MKPTITNAFNAQFEPIADANPDKPSDWSGTSGVSLEKSSESGGHSDASLASSLSPMQADLSEADFGWSLELSPMQAIDALQALSETCAGGLAYLLALEQSAWRQGDHELPLAGIAARLDVSVVNQISPDVLVVDHRALQELVSVCEPSRLLVVAVDGDIDERDSLAITVAIEDGRSPLLAELRAVWAVEVVGNRSLVMHCRDRDAACTVVAANFRHYLAALLGKPDRNFVAPANWQVQRLLDDTGALTVRPIETQVLATSVDIGVNTARDRFSQPAGHSLIFDRPSNSWHDEE